MGNKENKELISRLQRIKGEILIKYPFFGYLIMHTNLKLEPCNTAYTDVRNICFDPDFASRLSDKELEFTFLHEVLHIVLNHCIRANGHIRDIYNVAADIVVNSIIMEVFKVDEFSLDGVALMHRDKSGKEGRELGVEEIYAELIKQVEKQLLMSDDLKQLIQELLGACMDDHSSWSDIENPELLQKEWEKLLEKAIDYAKKHDSPFDSDEGDIFESELIRNLLVEADYQSRVDWQGALRDFIQKVNDSFDYSFLPPDRRLLAHNLILPDFNESISEVINNIWFVIDTSASMSDEQISQLFEEIKCCVSGLGHLGGKLSFFDVKLTEPVDFCRVDDLKDIKPVGGGGTDFSCIFRGLDTHMQDGYPTAIVVMTDGEASFNDENLAKGIPVLWALTNKKVIPPWGNVLYIE